MSPLLKDIFMLYEPEDTANHNTVTDGYIPVVREIHGIILVTKGVAEFVLGKCLPFTEDAFRYRYPRHLKDGIINLTWSPLNWLISGYFIRKFTKIDA